MHGGKEVGTVEREGGREGGRERLGEERERAEERERESESESERERERERERPDLGCRRYSWKIQVPPK